MNKEFEHAIINVLAVIAELKQRKTRSEKNENYITNKYSALSIAQLKEEYVKLSELIEAYKLKVFTQLMTTDMYFAEKERKAVRDRKLTESLARIREINKSKNEKNEN